MAAYFPNLKGDHLALYAIPGAWALAMAPRIYGVVLYNLAAGKHIDVKQPRQFFSGVKDDERLDAATKGAICRSDAAHNNGYENLGFFASAVVAASVVGVEGKLVNRLSYGYLLSRVLYNYFYIVGTSGAKAAARTIAYFGGIGLICTLYISAANKLRRL